MCRLHVLEIYIMINWLVVLAMNSSGSTLVPVLHACMPSSCRCAGIFAIVGGQQKVMMSIIHVCMFCLI